MVLVIGIDLKCLFEEVTICCNVTKELTNLCVLGQSLAQNIFRLIDFSDDQF
jgi:hypothetical protein